MFTVLSCFVNYSATIHTAFIEVTFTVLYIRQCNMAVEVRNKPSICEGEASTYPL